MLLVVFGSFYFMNLLCTGTFVMQLYMKMYKLEMSSVSTNGERACQANCHSLVSY